MRRVSPRRHGECRHVECRRHVATASKSQLAHAARIRAAPARSLAGCDAATGPPAAMDGLRARLRACRVGLRLGTGEPWGRVRRLRRPLHAAAAVAQPGRYAM
jgi:hypothetical protein